MASPSQPMSADPSQHRQELIERLDILRTNQSFCDVTVAVKDKEFKAHKVVLAAASPFIRSLLASDMRESKEQLIKIELEEATASVMEAVLQYVYTGDVSVTEGPEESAHNLIATADYLLLPGLKTMACNFLKENMTLENCIFNYYFADKYRCVELGEKAREVINSNFSVIVETEDFLSLDMKQVMEWVSSDDITVNAEEEVFKGIVKWVSHNKSERETHFPELFHEVRLVSISHDNLFNELLKEEHVSTNNECLNIVLAAMKGIFNPADECVTKSPRKCLETQTDVIFVCGGKKSLCYVPQQSRWYRLADMIFEHKCHAVTQYKDKVYAVGGKPERPEQCVTEYYLPSINSWGAIQREINASSFSSFVNLKGHLYAVCTNVLTCRTVYTYDPEKNAWVGLEGPAEKRWSTCGATDGQHLYIAGGIGVLNEELDPVATTERFDPSENKWESVAPMNERRFNSFGAGMNGKVYIAGGQQYHGVCSACEMYNPLTNEWQRTPSLKVPRQSASMVCFKGELYVLGGYREHRESRLLYTECKYGGPLGQCLGRAS
ncbi:kelch-like protein 3 [Oculina patagonica]